MNGYQKMLLIIVAHRVVRILEVGILGQKWNHGILFLPNF